MKVLDSNQQCQEKDSIGKYALIMSFAILMYLPLIVFYGILDSAFHLAGIANQSVIASVLAQLFAFIGLFVLAVLFIVKGRMVSDWKKFIGRLKSDKYLLLRFVAIIIAIIIASGIVNQIVHIIVDWLNTLGGEVITPPGNSDNQVSIENTLNSSVPTFIVTSILVIVGAPLFEELVYRFGLIEFFKRIGYPMFGIVISALSFGLAHVITNGDIINSFPYIVSGLGFALTYKYFGDNIWYSITLHLMWNVMALIVATFFAA